MSKWMNGWTLLPCYSNWGTQQHHWDRWAWVNWQKLTYSLLLAEHTCGLPSGSVVRDLPITQEKFDPWVRKIPWRRKWQPTSVLLPGKFHGQRSLMDYSPWGHKESDMPEWLTLSLFQLYFIWSLWANLRRVTLIMAFNRKFVRAWLVNLECSPFVHRGLLMSLYV